MSQAHTCIIVDDEPPAVRILQKYVAQLPGLECVAATNKAIEALQLVEQHKPDVLFLDIQMPDLTGIQLSLLLKDKTKIIFTTAYPQFAVEVFELNAVDYLLKPVAFNRFIAAVDKAKELLQALPQQNVAANEAEEDYFFIKTDGKNRFKRIAIADVAYLESIKNYVVIHTPQEQTVTYNTLKHFEENLPAKHFVKIHKSYIVALRKIEKTDNNEVWVMQKNLPLGDTYKTAFFNAILKLQL